MGLDEVADELYRLPPPEFTAARDRRQREARAAGDRDLAAQIRQLRKPTAGAWLANFLVREQPEQVRDLLDLGVAMREAQQALAGGDLATLSRQRQLVIGALSRDVRRRAAEAGHQVTSSAGIELEETLRAALADQGAADLLLAGRLTTALRPVAGGFDLGAGGSPVPAPEPAPSGKSEAAASKAERQRAKLRAAADEAIRRVRLRAEEAQRVADDLTIGVQRQQADSADRQLRIRELEAELNRVAAEESLGQREIQRMQAQLARASEHADEARRDLSAAQDHRRSLDQ